MTRDEQEAFRKITTRPELRDLRPDGKSAMSLVVFVTLVAACAETLGCGLAGLFLNDWRWIIAGILIVVVTLMLGVAIEGFRARKP